MACKQDLEAEPAVKKWLGPRFETKQKGFVNSTAFRGIEGWWGGRFICKRDAQFGCIEGISGRPGRNSAVSIDNRKIEKIKVKLIRTDFVDRIGADIVLCRRENGLVNRPAAVWTRGIHRWYDIDLTAHFYSIFYFSEMTVAAAEIILGGGGEGGAIFKIFFCNIV